MLWHEELANLMLHVLRWNSLREIFLFCLLAPFLIADSAQQSWLPECEQLWVVGKIKYFPRGKQIVKVSDVKKKTTKKNEKVSWAFKWNYSNVFQSHFLTSFVQNWLPSKSLYFFYTMMCMRCVSDMCLASCTRNLEVIFGGLVLFFE